MKPSIAVALIIFPFLTLPSISHGGRNGWGGRQRGGGGGWGGGGGGGGWNRPNQGHFPSQGWNGNQFGHGHGNPVQFQRPQNNFGHGQGLGWGWPSSGYFNDRGIDGFLNLFNPYGSQFQDVTTTTPPPETTQTPTEPPPIIVIETGHNHNGKEQGILVDEAGPISSPNGDFDDITDLIDSRINLLG